ncbi:MAG: hypothetical protein JXA25_06005 [Anaerolineales bacterium]|nr:hypothetical protein [Anaerolineales bacterium]
MAEPILVEAVFQDDGELRPVAFEWCGTLHRIQSIGRTRLVEGVRYYLVSTQENVVFEIGYHTSEGWQLYRSMRDFLPPGNRRDTV